MKKFRDVCRRLLSIALNLFVLCMEPIALPLSWDWGQEQIFTFYTEDSNIFAAVVCTMVAVCQLWCIFTGKMSFVGPRPLPTYYGPYFLPEERKRHTVRGGLIPPDSLSGKTYTTYEEQFAYECYYAEHLSFLLDIKVIYTTFRILWGRVTTGYGAQMDRPHLNVYRKDMDKKE